MLVIQWSYSKTNQNMLKIFIDRYQNQKWSLKNSKLRMFHNRWTLKMRRLNSNRVFRMAGWWRHLRAKVGGCTTSTSLLGRVAGSILYCRTGKTSRSEISFFYSKWVSDGKWRQMIDTQACLPISKVKLSIASCHFKYTSSTGHEIKLKPSGGASGCRYTVLGPQLQTPGSLFYSSREVSGFSQVPWISFPETRLTPYIQSIHELGPQLQTPRDHYTLLFSRSVWVLLSPLDIISRD